MTTEEKMVTYLEFSERHRMYKMSLLFVKSYTQELLAEIIAMEQIWVMDALSSPPQQKKFSS